MRFRRLSEPRDLESYAAAFEGASSVRIPTTYFERSHVVGAFDRSGLIGGYALAPGPVMRWPNQVPARLSLLDRVPLDALFELNAVWLATALRYSRHSAWFWLHLARDVGSRRGAHITFVANPKKPGLVALYEKLRPETIYEGPFTNSSLTEAKVYDVSATSFRRIWIFYARDLAARVLTRASGGR